VLCIAALCAIRLLCFNLCKGVGVFPALPAANKAREEDNGEYKRDESLHSLVLGAVVGISRSVPTEVIFKTGKATGCDNILCIKGDQLELRSKISILHFYIPPNPHYRFSTHLL
jgi:hypothetical protein